MPHHTDFDGRTDDYCNIDRLSVHRPLHYYVFTLQPFTIIHAQRQLDNFFTTQHEISKSCIYFDQIFPTCLFKSKGSKIFNPSFYVKTCTVYSLVNCIIERKKKKGINFIWHPAYK